MDENNARKCLETRIAELERQLEQSRQSEKANRIPARHFMIFFLAGGDPQTKDILQKNVLALLRNPEACTFISVEEETAGLGKHVESIIKDCAGRHVEVDDFNTIFLCPIFFADGEQALTPADFGFLSQVGEHVKQMSRIPVWQPFLVVDRVTDQYSNINLCIKQIIAFITGPGKGCSNRCCLLSRTDENSFGVSIENLCLTIAMTAVLQNTKSQNADTTGGLLRKVQISVNDDDADRGKLFFTSRSAAVTNPRKSVILRRIISALDFCAGDTDASSKDAIDEVRYNFINSVIAPYRDKLPTIGGKISFYPLLSVMDDMEELKSAVKKYYTDPLYGPKVKESLIRQTATKFLKAYFANNGSISGLCQLIERGDLVNIFRSHKKECFEEIKFDEELLKTLRDSKSAQRFAEGSYMTACQSVMKSVREHGANLLEELAKELSGDQRMALRISKGQKRLQDVKDALECRLKHLQKTETILTVGRNETCDDFGKVQDAWFQDYQIQYTEKVSQLNTAFDQIVCEMLETGSDRTMDLLDLLYQAVAASACGNRDFLSQVSDECARDAERAKEFIGIVEQNWHYTLNLIVDQLDATDTTYIIGDPDYGFCRLLEQKFQTHHGGKLFEFSGFDRIDLLHISNPFSHKSLKEWSQIEKSDQTVRGVSE